MTSTKSMVSTLKGGESEALSLRQKIVVLILIFLVMASSIAVSYSVHVSRKTVASLAVLEKQKHDIEVEWGRLLIEQSAWGAYGRVERIAAKQLGMIMPEPTSVVMLKKE